MNGLKSLELLKQIIIVNKDIENYNSFFKEYYNVIKKDLELLNDLLNYICFENEEEDECHQYVVFDRFICNDDMDTEELFYRLKGYFN